MFTRECLLFTELKLKMHEKKFLIATVPHTYTHAHNLSSFFSFILSFGCLHTTYIGMLTRFSWIHGYICYGFLVTFSNVSWNYLFICHGFSIEIISHCNGIVLYFHHNFQRGFSWYSVLASYRWWHTCYSASHFSPPIPSDLKKKWSTNQVRRVEMMIFVSYS